MVKTRGSNHRNGPHRVLIQRRSTRRHQPGDAHRLSAPLLGASLACNSEIAAARQALGVKGAELPANTMLLPIQSPSAPVFLRLEIFSVKKNLRFAPHLKIFGVLARSELSCWEVPGEERCRIGCQAPALGLGVTSMSMSVMYHPRISCRQLF